MTRPPFALLSEVTLTVPRVLLRGLVPFRPWASAPRGRELSGDGFPNTADYLLKWTPAEGRVFLKKGEPTF